MNYSSGPASLFSAIARDISTHEPEPATAVTVTCSWCLSENVVMIDHELHIYECKDCGEVFSRPF